MIRFWFVFSAVVAIAAADCNTLNCIEGTCVSGACQCNDLFTGDDCSVPYEKCGHHGDRKCFNGSECVKNNERDPVTHKHKYHCDCSKAFGISSFAGTQCEYSATAICEFGVEASQYSFCTNSGKCVETVASGRQHQGCICPQEFEGLHCQYLKGEAPEEELEAVAALEASRSGGSDLTDVAVAFIVIVVLAVVGMLGFVIWRKRTTGIEKPAAVGDLDFAKTADEEEEEEISTPDII